MQPNLSKTKVLSLMIAPSITGCISAFASTALIVSIFRSRQKLSTIYRRLIFCLSAFDILQSISQVLTSLPMPAGTISGAIGNDITCDIQGFFISIGICGAVLYSLSLTVYFLLVVKYDMNETRIKKYAEPFLHAIPIVYSLVISISIYATNNYNVAGMICWVAPDPLNCEDDPEVECLSSGNTAAFKWGVGGLIFIVFLLNCTILAVIWWEYRSQMKKNQAYGGMLAQTHPQVLESDEEEQTKSVGLCFSCCLARRSKKNNLRSSVLADYLSRPSRASVRRLEEISNRASAYAVAFILSFTFTLIYRLYDTYGSGPTPFTIIFLSRISYPLQGLFNVLVYTSPHVTAYRRNHTECNWFQAFWNVIKSGGDSDQSRFSFGRANRSESLRERQRVLAQSENSQRMTPRRGAISFGPGWNNRMMNSLNDIEAVALNFSSTHLEDFDRRLSIEYD